MIIDFHSHICPDKIAVKVDAKMKADNVYLCGSFTLQGLKSHMTQCGIDKIVTFCVAEKAQVVKPSNDFIISITDNKKIIGFGTILPDFEDPAGEIKRLKSKGIKGIKFNSLYQDIRPCDENLFPIYEEMAEDMIAMFHCGRSPSHPERPPRATPQGIGKLRELFPRLKIVAAHLGGFAMLEESEQYVLGKNIYIDISWNPSLRQVSTGTLLRLFRKNGIDKVLFGTDYPFPVDPKDNLQYLMSLPLTDAEKEKILYRNAEELLQI
ncbi:MAG: amidohydrolase family protein [Chloroflexota bacterium]